MRIPAIANAARSDAFRDYLTRLLVEICGIDTTPRPDIDKLRRAESAVFDVLERELRSFAFASSRVERPAVKPAIAEHPFFSRLYYTVTADRPGGMSVEECYRGRGNLLFCVDGDRCHAAGVSQAINAHIDVVSPFVAPRVEGRTVFGRGANDDKGNVIAAVGALKLLSEHLRERGGRLNRDLTVMLVIDEETGGNGSLSLAIDRDLRSRYDSMVVLECAAGGIHPGNRGCVWYRIEGRLAGANLFEAAMFIVEGIEHEGRAIRAESDHPLFPHRPVQTCHGIIGSWGEHPSRINGEVVFRIRFGARLAGDRVSRLIRDVLEDGLREYVGLYGDKTRAIDASTGRPKVERHYDLSESADGCDVRVWGSTGHMGAILENDGAITKMAAMGRALVRSRAAIEAAAGSAMRLELDRWPDASSLLMEGGQGFLPTHSMDAVQDRIRRAAWRGAGRYSSLMGVDADASKWLHVSYEKLHNAAFAGPVDSPDMRNAIEAARDAGMRKEGPIRGWDVSCDARIFACEYPGMPVITTGAGLLQYAHSDDERIDMDEVARTAELLAHFILRQTATR